MEGLFNPQQWNHLHKHLSEMGLASSLLQAVYVWSLPTLHPCDTVRLRLLKILWLVWTPKVRTTSSKSKKPRWRQTQMKGERSAWSLALPEQGISLFSQLSWCWSAVTSWQYSRWRCVRPKLRRRKPGKTVVKKRSSISSSKDNYTGWRLGTLLGSKRNGFGSPPIRDEL